MDAEHIELIEPREDLRDALLDYLEEFRAAGEPFRQQDLDCAREDFEGYLRERREWSRGVNVPPDLVPETHYWLVRGGRILGTIRLRHRLNERLEIEGGHIGYKVRPSERRKGFAKGMLAMVLPKARAMGLARVLVTCDKDNVASARVIRANGGELHSEVVSPDSGKPVQRYWIELADRLEPRRPATGHRGD